MVWAPLQYRAPFCVGTMGAGHFGQFEFMEVTEGKPYNRASSVGRFIGRSFCVHQRQRPVFRGRHAGGRHFLDGGAGGQL